MRNKKAIAITYYISTALVTFTLAMGAYLYLTRQTRIVNVFSNVMIDGYNAVGFPAWLVIPMGIAKLSGAVALWAPIPKWLREWAYAGAFFNFILALGAHVFNPVNPNDQDFTDAIIAIILLIISRYTLFLKENLVSKNGIN